MAKKKPTKKIAAAKKKALAKKSIESQKRDSSKKSAAAKKRSVAPKKSVAKSVKKKKSVSVLMKKNDKDYRSLYQKIYRRKKKIEDIFNKKEKGWKGKRSKIYKDVVMLNKELLSLCKRKKYKVPESIKVRKKQVNKLKKKEEFVDAKKGIRTYSAGVWDFESQLAKILKAKAFKTIIIVNVNKKFSDKTPPTTVLFWYDVARDSAYSEQFSSTPFVDVTEDEIKSVITIEVVS